MTAPLFTARELGNATVRAHANAVWRAEGPAPDAPTPADAPSPADRGFAPLSNGARVKRIAMLDH